MQRLLVWTFHIHLGREERLDEEQGICCSWHSGWSVSCLAQEWSLAERTHKSSLLGTYVVVGQEPAQPSCEYCCWIEIGKWEGFSAGQGALPRWPFLPARVWNRSKVQQSCHAWLCLFISTVLVPPKTGGRAIRRTKVICNVLFSLYSPGKCRLCLWRTV